MRPDEGDLVVQFALLDTAGDTRGSNASDAAFRQIWPAASVQNFTRVDELSAWERELPAQSFVKVIYDRPAAEIRVTGVSRGSPFSKVFPVGSNLNETLTEVADFIREKADAR